MAKRALGLGRGMVLAATVASWFGCGPDHPSTEGITIELEDVAIAPTKASGLPWDCCGVIDPNLPPEIEAIRTIQDPYIAADHAYAALARWSFPPLIAPEVVGHAQLFVGALEPRTVRFEKVWERDTYTPRLFAEQGRPPGWYGVSAGPATRIVGELWDADLVEQTKDRIGDFEVTYYDIVTALRRQSLHPVRGRDQVLFVRIRVYGEE